jgi:hypothetical protein
MSVAPLQAGYGGAPKVLMKCTLHVSCNCILPVMLCPAVLLVSPWRGAHPGASKLIA